MRMKNERKPVNGKLKETLGSPGLLRFEDSHSCKMKNFDHFSKLNFLMKRDSENFTIDTN